MNIVATSALPAPPRSLVVGRSAQTAWRYLYRCRLYLGARHVYIT